MSQQICSQVKGWRQRVQPLDASEGKQNHTIPKLARPGHLVEPAPDDTSSFLRTYMYTSQPPKDTLTSCSAAIGNQSQT